MRDSQNVERLNDAVTTVQYIEFAIGGNVKYMTTYKQKPSYCSLENSIEWNRCIRITLKSREGLSKHPHVCSIAQLIAATWM